MPSTFISSNDVPFKSASEKFTNDIDNPQLTEEFMVINGGGQVGSNDVDDFNTILTSPIFDLSQPLSSNQSYYLEYHSWFSNGFGGWGGGSPAAESGAQGARGGEAVTGFRRNGVTGRVEHRQRVQLVVVVTVK